MNCPGVCARMSRGAGSTVDPDHRPNVEANLVGEAYSASVCPRYDCHAALTASQPCRSTSGFIAFPICPPGAVPPNLEIQQSQASRDQATTGARSTATNGLSAA